jgi:hypothetical protein
MSEELPMVWSLLLAAVVAALVATLVANYVARRKPRVVDTLNARHLQIWGPDGNVQATLHGGNDGASLVFSGDSIANLYLTRRKITFRTAGRSLSKDGDEDDTVMVDRVELGVDGDGSGVLRFYSDIVADVQPTSPVTEFKLTRGGVHKVFLRVGSPRVDIAETPEGLVVSPGGARIRVVGTGGATIWSWPRK